MRILVVSRYLWHRPRLIGSRSTGMPLINLLLAGTLLLLSACASTGMAPGASHTGSAAGSAAGVASIALTGTLTNVDHNNQRLLLAADDKTLVDIAYDEATQGNAPAGLKPDDRIRVQVVRAGRLWHAESIQLATAARTSGTESGPASAANAPEQVQGVVSEVDRSARILGFTEDGVTGAERRIRYDTRTRVVFEGGAYGIDELQRGDVVRLVLSRSDQGWVAERIAVESRASDH